MNHFSVFHAAARHFGDPTRASLIFQRQPRAGPAAGVLLVSARWPCSQVDERTVLRDI